MQPARRLRIAVIAHNRFPIRQPFAGGLESHVWYLARALADRGHDVSLFASPGSDLDIGSTPSGVAIHSIGKKCRPQWRAPIPDHRDFRSLMDSLIDDAGRSFDVVHNHAYHYWPVLLAARLPVPMVTTLHTAPVLWLKSAIKCSDGKGSAYATVSHFAAQQWRDVVDDVMVVNNGVQLAAWPVGPGGTTLAWCGRITPEKGPHAAIDAARRAGMPLTLAGRIDNQRYFRRMIMPRLGKDITYVGHLAQPELAKLLGEAAAALVTPYWDEAYGLVAAEAISCGTPVIAFGRGAIPDIVTPDVGRVVTPGDIPAMAAAIRDIPTISRGDVRRHAETHLSHDATVDRYVALYRSLVTQQSECPPVAQGLPAPRPDVPTPSMSKFAATLCRTSLAHSVSAIGDAESALLTRLRQVVDPPTPPGEGCY
ncbi:glycosyltransferase [Mycolicibacterium sp. J2]|uniref:glycosyltransferase n=1 Tax=Mycolicibacterium sp. J2 TaxID=2993511 RepID=UPI00224B4C45|nr:glycosyltransferase [Mycolicibacterium sp. J2]MCX2713507.1 glycosyltransferase [Mycolicibacterium sp. J2]